MKTKQRTDWIVISGVWTGDEWEETADAFDSRDDTLAHMGNCYACGSPVWAVYHGGKRIAEVDQEKLKAESIDGLGPISKARALGRIP